jgi:hypothetical protein
LAAIELIPDIVRVIDEAEAQRQQIVMFEETLNTFTNAARRAKQNLNPGGVVSDDYSVKEFICQSVDVVNLLGRRVDELIKFNGAAASEQQQQLLALQAENSRLTALFNDAHSQYEKLQKETERLRLELEADTLNTRTPENKRRHDVYNNLKNFC